MPDAVVTGATMVTMPLRTFSFRALAAVALAGTFAAIALPASAHAELVSSDPEDGATVAELTTIHLEFSEDLLEIGNSVVVTDGAGVAHDAELTFPKPNQIDAAVTDVAPGEATIAWRNASVDGHTEEGELTVTVLAPSPSPSASPSPTPTVTVTATASPSPSPSVSPSAAPIDNADGGVNPWLLGLLGLVVIGGAAAALIAATRKRPSED
jgi:methionine-rich copper-binding protein CopC